MILDNIGPALSWQRQGTAFQNLTDYLFNRFSPLRIILVPEVIALCCLTRLAKSSVARPGPLVAFSIVQRIVQVYASASVAAAFEWSLMTVELHGWCETLKP